MRPGWKTGFQAAVSILESGAPGEANDCAALVRRASLTQPIAQAAAGAMVVRPGWGSVRQRCDSAMK